MEALTELQIAWKQPETVQLLNGEGRAAVLRSWWIVSEALAAIGDKDSELSALAQLARRTIEPAVRDSVAALEKKPDDPEAFASVLYASLAMRDKEFTAKVLPLLTTSTGKDDALLTLRTIAKALLDVAEQTDTAGIGEGCKRWRGRRGPHRAVGHGLQAQ